MSGAQVFPPYQHYLIQSPNCIDSYPFILLILSNFDFDLSACLNEASFLKILESGFEILNLFKRRFDENESRNNEIKNGEGYIS